MSKTYNIYPVDESFQTFACKHDHGGDRTAGWEVILEMIWKEDSVFVIEVPGRADQTYLEFTLYDNGRILLAGSANQADQKVIHVFYTNGYNILISKEGHNFN